MRKKRTSLSFSNIGTVSLLMVFIVLCLVIFAILSLSDTLSDLRYSRQLAESNSAYYTASNTAEEELADIDAALLSAREQTEQAADWPEQACQALASLPDLTVKTDDTLPEICYDIPIDDSFQLHVELTLQAYEDTAESLFTVTCWQKQSLSSEETTELADDLPALMF